MEQLSRSQSQGCKFLPLTDKQQDNSKGLYEKIEAKEWKNQQPEERTKQKQHRGKGEKRC